VAAGTFAPPTSTDCLAVFLEVTDEEPTAEDFQTPDYYRARAQEAREKANAMHTAELKERMLAIAADYDKLAEFAIRDIVKVWKGGRV
jgi:hypothetical protein